VQAPDLTYPLFNDAALDAAPSISDLVSFGEAIGLRPSRVARSAVSGDASITLLESTGWARIDHRDASVVVDAGPDASGFQPGHAHADGLGFEAWIGGDRTVVDFGVATYEKGPQRAETRATRSHNTVEIGGRDSCEVWGAFRVGRRGRGRIVKTGFGGEAAWIDLEHDGYAWLPDRPIHRRRLSLRAGAIEGEDRVSSGRESCASRLRLDRSGGARVRIGGPFVRSDDRWYPRHGSSVAADVYAQTFRAGDSDGARWRIEW
jgi:uncharacterized heparinase superfamily protein